MRVSKPRICATTFATTLAVAAAVLTPVVTAAPAQAAAPCGKTAPDRDNSTWRATANGVNMRSGSSTGCRSNGLAARGDKLDYHCYTWGPWIGETRTAWTYARNTRTGVQGWLRTDTMSDFGSDVYCGF
ncbi:SH3 domain-containing protein [Streptomyces sp. NPDC018029]|uniref:SH3 domain-containing protein n=1 Tax=Streptomyces sp. NPDC018029 TaxID=3365032 RepID=UPI0037974D13